MEPTRELKELAAVDAAPCVTLYLNLGDGPARERGDSFAHRRIERALRVTTDETTRADLGLVLAEVGRRFEVPGGANAIAIFACGSASVFRVMELDATVQDELVIGAGPALRQLASLSDRYERTLVVLVSSEAARIFDIVLGRATEEASLSREHETKEHSGWMQMHYQHHMREQIERHLREVAHRTVELVDRDRPVRIVLGGVQPAIDMFRHLLPSRVRTKVTDVVALPPEARVTEIVHRALAQLETDARRRETDAVAETINLALSGGPAALGIDEVLEAASERRLMSVVMLASRREAGTRCRNCGSLFRERKTCRSCSGTCEEIDLGEALLRAAITQDASVEVVPHSEALSKLGGITAKLRW